MNGRNVLPATVMDFANRRRSTILADSEVSNAGRLLSGMELYNSYEGRARHRRLALTPDSLLTWLMKTPSPPTMQIENEPSVSGL